MTGEFITTQDPRWKALLAEVAHDFYHIPEYIQLEADHTGGEATAFYAERGNARFLIPLVQCPMPSILNALSGDCDVTSPYGYSSPLLHCGGGEDQLRLFMEAFCEAGAQRGIVTAFLRLHPLLPLPIKVLSECGEVIHHGQTVYFDLDDSEDDAAAALCKNHRRDLKTLKAAGFQVQLDNWSHYPRFIEIYRATMERLEASEMYFFRGDYFWRLREALGDSLHLSTVLSPDGEVAAAGLFVHSCGIVQYHLAGTAEEYCRQSPVKLMVDWMRHWARACGAKSLHLGGGLGGHEDSLFRFKSGFTSHRAEFFTCRITLDEAKYRQLVGQWHRAGGLEEIDNHFFPAHRRPLA
jgi:hypothetical protein